MLCPDFNEAELGRSHYLVARAGTAMSNITKHVRRDWFCLAMLLLLALWSVRALLPVFGKEIIGDGGDAPLFAWNLWWINYSLRHLHPIWQTNLLFAPPETTWLVSHTLTPVSGLLSLPLQWAFGLIIAHNLLYVLQLCASLVLSYVLARRLQLSPSGSVVASVVFSLSPAITSQAQGHFNLTASWYIPAALFCLELAAKKAKARYWMLFGLVLGLVTLNDIYMAVFTCFSALFWVYGMRRSYSHLLQKSLHGLSVALLTACVTVAPLLIAGIHAGRDYIPPKVTAEKYRFYSNDLTRFAVPSFQHPIFGWLYRTVPAQTTLGIERVAYVGLLPIALVLAACIGRVINDSGSRRAAILLGALFFCWLSMGPRLYIAGHAIMVGSVDLGWPALIVTQLPLLNRLMVLSRFAIPGMLFVGLLAGQGITLLEHRLSTTPRRIPNWTRWVLWLLIVGLILFEYSADIETYPLPRPETFTVVQQAQLDAVTLNIPLKIGTGRAWNVGNGFSAEQFAQTYYERPMIGGLVSYAPERVAQRVLSEPSFQWLLDQSIPGPETVAQFGRTLTAWHVKYIIVWDHDPSRRWYTMPPDYSMRVHHLIAIGLKGEIVSQSNDATVYRLP